MWELRPSSKPSNGTRGNRDEVIATIATDKASKEPSERNVFAEGARREEPSLPQTREQTQRSLKDTYESMAQPIRDQGENDDTD